MAAIITLTTDFGTGDGYVGAMKGVIVSRAPDARIIDIAHDIPRGDIAHAAWVLFGIVREFPADAIHVGVVDPGVGGKRKKVIVKSWGTLVGPDNGVFAYVAPPAGAADRAWAIESPNFRAHAVGHTFHGRDVFAVAAAELARGRQAASAGRAVVLAGALPWGNRPANEGRIVHIDHFGNLVTDLPAEEVDQAVLVAGQVIALCRTYSEVAPDALLAYIGSMNTVEIAVRDGRADQRLGVPRGTAVLPATKRTGPYR